MSDKDQFKQKSIENWAAAESLKDKCKNAAVSRYYYALYQAARYWAATKGLVRCVDYVDHAAMANIIGRNGGTNARDLREAVNDMCEQRVIADYKPFQIADTEVKPIIQKASAARAFFLQ